MALASFGRRGGFESEGLGEPMHEKWKAVDHNGYTSIVSLVRTPRGMYVHERRDVDGGPAETLTVGALPLEAMRKLCEESYGQREWIVFEQKVDPEKARELGRTMADGLVKILEDPKFQEEAANSEEFKQLVEKMPEEELRALLAEESKKPSLRGCLENMRDRLVNYATYGHQFNSAELLGFAEITQDAIETLERTRKALVDYVLEDAAEHGRSLTGEEAERYVDRLVEEVKDGD